MTEDRQCEFNPMGPSPVEIEAHIGSNLVECRLNFVECRLNLVECGLRYQPISLKKDLAV